MVEVVVEVVVGVVVEVGVVVGVEVGVEVEVVVGVEVVVVVGVGVGVGVVVVVGVVNNNEGIIEPMTHDIEKARAAIEFIKGEIAYGKNNVFWLTDKLNEVLDSLPPEPEPQVWEFWLALDNEVNISVCLTTKNEMQRWVENFPKDILKRVRTDGKTIAFVED